MGRTRIVLDPASRHGSPYLRPKEPGFYYWISGVDLYRNQTQGKRDDGSTEQVSSGLFLPPGSEWLTARPKQLDPEHFRDGSLDAYVVDESDWSIATGVTVSEFEPTFKPSGSTNSLNKWMHVQSGATITPITPEAWDNIFEGAQVTMPSGFASALASFSKTFAASTIYFYDVAQEPRDYHPFIQWRGMPSPDASWAFAFGPLVFIISDGVVTVLKDDPADSPRYSLLGKIDAHSVGNVMAMAASDHSLLIMPDGLEDISVFYGSSDKKGFTHKRFTIRKADSQIAPGPLFYPAGPWTIGMSPNAKLALQVQVVAYDIVDFGNLANPELLFELGQYYKPSIDPIVRLVTRFDVPQDGADQIVETVDPVNGTTLTNDFDGSSGSQSITYKLEPYPEPAMGWDGESNWGASLLLTFTAGAPDHAITYLAPQIRRLELTFPTVLEERPFSSLTLSDAEFSGWELETSYYEPLAKRLRVDFWDSGVQALVTSGHIDRDWFPIHIDEEVSSGVWVTRVAAWVRKLELEEKKTTNPDTQASVRRYTLEADALLCRLDTDWAMLPQMVDAENPHGYIEHTYAVERTVQQGGFDTDDPTMYFPQVDPAEDTEISRLPGSWGTGSGQTAKRISSDWAPDWDKSKLEYAKMIAHDWRGWVLREEMDGLIRYHQDLMVEGNENALHSGLPAGIYYSLGTLYWSAADATAASRPRQYIMAGPHRHRTPPRANVIRIDADEPGDSLFPHVLERWEATLDNVAHPNFMGEYVTMAFTPKLAISEQAMKQLCRIKLLQLGRRSSPWSVEIPIAPWRFIDADGNPTILDAGHVITLDGDAYGAYLVVHMQVVQVKSADSADDEVYVTRLTLDKLPSQMTGSSTPGAYPGQGVDA